MLLGCCSDWVASGLLLGCCWAAAETALLLGCCCSYWVATGLLQKLLCDCYCHCGLLCYS